MKQSDFAVIVGMVYIMLAFIYASHGDYFFITCIALAVFFFWIGRKDEPNG
jgi:hypothetical protein